MDEGILFEHGPKGSIMLNDDENVYEWDLNEEKKACSKWSVTPTMQANVTQGRV